jgi:hypothetical protein
VSEKIEFYADSDQKKYFGKSAYKKNPIPQKTVFSGALFLKYSYRL